EYGFVQTEALAAERAAAHARSIGELQQWRGYLGRARDCYARWGALAKVLELERALADPSAASVMALPPASLTTTLDLLTVVKASQAMSGELELEKLLVTLLELFVQHAGAQRGALLLPDGNGLRWAAAAEVDGQHVSATATPEGSLDRDLPAVLIHYVHRTRHLVVGGPEDMPPFLSDVYLENYRPESLLCAPISRRGQPVATFYLEHRQLAGAFTPAHLS